MKVARGRPGEEVAAVLQRAPRVVAEIRFRFISRFRTTPGWARAADWRSSRNSAVALGAW